MKKLTFLFLFSLIVLSCSSDDDANDLNKLATPVLLTPSNNTTVDVELFGANQFVWSQIANTDQYLIQISEDPEFSNIVLDGTVQIDEEEPYYNTRYSFTLQDLQDQSTYYWRVQALGAGYDPSDFSEMFAFTVNMN